MATVIGSNTLEKGILPKAITSSIPLGMIFYPTETYEIDESTYDEEVLKKLSIEILETLKENMAGIGKKVFEIIKIPSWFTYDDVYNKWIFEINKVFDKLINKIRDEGLKLTGKDKLLIEQLKLNRGIEIAINKDKKTILKTLIKNYRSHINESFDVIEETLYTIRRKYGKIFLESMLNPKFMTYISKTINVMISYFHYLKSELNNVLAELRRILSGRGSISHFKKDTKAVFTRIIKLDIKQYELLLKIVELDLFMDIWSSKTIDELFKPKEVYSNENLDNIHFEDILNDLNKASMELHFELIKISRERKKDVLFTFSNNYEEKDEEKMYLISRLIHDI
ncbi:MAG: hypothetical protein HZR80_01100 [Candidatus Heimdallarchaeota archaeon]